MSHKQSSFWNQILLPIFISATLTIVILECGLRIFGFPKGVFRFIVSTDHGLYPPNLKTEFGFGNRSYKVETNSLGFRSNEIALSKMKGSLRIACVGDSFTDGFFVDNPDTYPIQLEKLLTEQKVSVEVINAAMGGGSIDKEFAMLRDNVAILKPDLVLLLFYTNDLSDLRGKSLHSLSTMSLKSNQYRSFKRRIAEWILVETAIGDAFSHLLIKSRHRISRSLQTLKNEPNPGIDNLAGGREYAKNVALFNAIYASKKNNFDGLAIEEPLSSEAQFLSQNYLAVLRQMNDFTKQIPAQLILIYMPAYSQIYDDHATFGMLHLLKKSCDSMRIPFFDLTPALKKYRSEGPMHLAPIDFHLNPKGNRVIAQAIAEDLRKITVPVFQPTKGPSS